MSIDMKLLKQLRLETSVSIADCRKALEESKNDYKKALDWVCKNGLEKAAKKADRETPQGLVESYIHQNGRVGALVEVSCETDFVARNELFQTLGKDLAMQVASMGDKDLLSQDFIKDPSKKVEDLVKEVIAKTGENVKVSRVWKITLGE